SSDLPQRALVPINSVSLSRLFEAMLDSHYPKIWFAKGRDFNMDPSASLIHPALIAVLALLPGCGGAPSQNVTPTAMAQGAIAAPSSKQARSWMLPEAKHEALLYMANWGCCLRVFSYPKGKPVGVVDAAPRLQGECSDKAGNVWVTSFGFSEILEFAHGGSSPIAVLTEDRNTDPWGCSVDPVTGNLAVTNTDPTIAIFPQAQGTRQPILGDFDYCAYEADGNLVADEIYPQRLFELRQG